VSYKELPCSRKVTFFRAEADYYVISPRHLHHERRFDGKVMLDF
jgi:hypothetical protein